MNLVEKHNISSSHSFYKEIDKLGGEIYNQKNNYSSPDVEQKIDEVIAKSQSSESVE